MIPHIWRRVWIICCPALSFGKQQKRYFSPNSSAYVLIWFGSWILGYSVLRRLVYWHHAVDYGRYCRLSSPHVLIERLRRLS